MRVASCVGEDLISVDLLRRLCVDRPTDLACLCDQVLRDGVIPDSWGVAILALIPKTQRPKHVRELRPICMSSAALKMLSRVVMNRTFEALREPNFVASSGKGRQPADLIGVFSRLRDVTREWREGVIAVKLDVEGAFDFIDRGVVADYIQNRLGEPWCCYELRFLLNMLNIGEVKGVAPGGKPFGMQTNRGVKQGSPESAELFGMIMATAIQQQCLGGCWNKPHGPLADMPCDVGVFQDDVFVWGDAPDAIEKNIALMSTAVASLGLRLAANKTKVISNWQLHYKGRRFLHVGGVRCEMATLGSSIRVLGVDFDLDASPGQQCQEAMARVWGAFHQHKELLCGGGSRFAKLRLVRALLEGVWCWTAGALHWGRDDLQVLNSLQARVLRLAFGVSRRKEEDWATYNARSLREIRAWMATHSIERWSTKVLRLQHSLLGHWLRRREGNDECMASCMLRWRDLCRWRGEQSLKCGRRHPRKFHANNLERDVAEVLGLNWKAAVHNREGWKNLLVGWLAARDVPWSRGRQLALQ